MGTALAESWKLGSRGQGIYWEVAVEPENVLCVTLLYNVADSAQIIGLG
jgi:hypothetical protein